MSIRKINNFLFAPLILCLAFTNVARADETTYTIYEATKKDSSGNEYTVTVTVTADDSQTETHTFTDAEGESHTYYTNSTVSSPTVTITGLTDQSDSSNLSDLSLSYTSPNITQETSSDDIKQKYYAWVEEIDETTQEPTGKYVFTDVTDKVSSDPTTTVNVTVSYVDYGESHPYGNGIYNNSSTSDYNGKPITADFVGDTKHGESSGDHGGAIDNYAQSGNVSLGKITGNFIGNYESDETGSDYGGAIANYVSSSSYTATIESINGNFVGNYVSTTEAGSEGRGGAIYNSGSTATIGKIEGDFIGNYVERIDGLEVEQGEQEEQGEEEQELVEGTVETQGEQSSSSSQGGAIYNASGKIGSVTGNFIGNAAKSSGNGSKTVVEKDEETGELKKTTTEYGGSASGGAIYNSSGTISAIEGNFVGNYAETSGTSASGGAIRNSGTINTIKGDFIGNYANTTGTGSATGGAIYNSGTINALAGDFIGNSIYAAAGNTWGAAVYNTDSSGKIGSITGNFIGNGSESGSGTGRAGAIYNASGGTIGDITGDFIGNYSKSESNYVEGGAIFNNSSSYMGNITGNFIGNYAEALEDHARGGAIQNYRGSIGDLTGDYIGNYVNAGKYAYGGAIYNTSGSGIYGTIGDITGNFIGNYAHTSGTYAYGGAIFNSSTGSVIGNIKGNFINNYAKSTDSGTYAYGGAIYNSSSKVGDITANFIGNYVETSGTHAYGGAIYNYSGGSIGDIVGDFIGNYATSTGNKTSSLAWGGAIYNEGSSINSIKGNFIENKAESSANDSFGGAIYNEGTIGVYDADSGKATVDGISGSTFQGNTATRGGAIYNGTYKNSSYTWEEGVYNGIISSITDTWFVKNTATNYGGAIYNYDDGAIYSIANCYFMENVAENGNGGAIENAEAHAYIGAITNSYFYKNDVSVSDHGGGAIYNEGIIDSIANKNSFVENTSYNFGGAIYNNGGTIGTTDDGGNVLTGITGNYFEGNNSNRGGAIYNTTNRSLDGTEETLDYDLPGTITSIDGNYFLNNTANYYGGAIYNYHGGEIGSISNNYFEGNVALDGNGGAIENAESDATIGSISNNYFKGNKAVAYTSSGTDDEHVANENTTINRGGAIYNEGTIGTEDETTDDGTITGGISQCTFEANEAGDGGAIYNNGGTIGEISNSTFTENKATNGSGGAIYNGTKTDDKGTVYTGTIGTITNTSFVNNSATDKGGAIYSASDLSIVADGGSVVFQGNSDGTDDNAIYMATHYDDEGNSVASNLSFSLKNGGTIYMYDNIKGEGNYSVDISGDGMNNIFYLLNDVNAVSDVSPQSIKPYEADTSDATTNNADLSVGNVSLYTTLYTLSDEAHVYKTNSFTVTKDFDMYADVDFANEVMDHFETNNDGQGSLTDDSADESGHNGTLNVAGLNGLTDTDADRIAIYFAEEGLMKNVTSSAGTVYAPIHTYSANYVYLDDDGIHYGEDVYDAAESELFSSGNYESAGYFVFDKTGINPAVMATSVASMATYGFMSMMFEYNFEHSDYYMKLPESVRLAMNENAKKAPKENDATRPEYYNQNELTYRGAWARSFFSNESVEYGGGWTSRDKYYGAMLGFDSNMHVSKNGWANVTTGYIGTGGIRQQYSGGHIKQHGGFVGLTESFYKKNFYTAWTIAAGSMKAHEHTMYGHDKDRIDDYGIAARFGWNIDMDYNGKFAILPTFTASYSYVHPEDFVNAAGTNINGSGVRAVQLNPNVKFIWKMNDGWQPYLTVGEIWTVGESSHIRADSVKLPELDLKAYTEYGIGLQKRWANERDAYIQLLGHSDGRDGILVNAGLRWNF